MQFENNDPSNWQDFDIRIDGFENIMTPDLCIEMCRDTGYEYAGLQVGSFTYMFIVSHLTLMKSSLFYFHFWYFLS